MKNHNQKYKYILAFSLMINVIILLPYSGDLYERISRKVNPTEYFSVDTPDTLVLNSVVRASLKIDGTIMKQSEQKGLLTDLRNYYFKKERNSNTIYNYYKAYLLVGLSYYALNKRDKDVIEALVKLADDIVDERSDCLKYQINKIDQVPIGIMFINLYKILGNDKYMKVAHNIKERLLQFKNNEDLIYYINQSRTNFSDAVGMYVPFLMEYYNVSGDTLSKNIAMKNLCEYQKYGVDKETGIPVHGYDIKTHIKTGSANWGRGIGWYLLAASYCENFHDSILDSNIPKFDYTQFPFSNHQFDSSTALMFKMYENRKLHETKSIEFIKPYITRDGMVDSFSGDTYAQNDYSHSFGKSELGNGLLLMYYYGNKK